MMVRAETHRTRGAVFLTMMVALAIGVAAAVAVIASDPADAARPRFKVVTRTFSKPASINIPDTGSAAPYPSTIPVSGLTLGKILDVNVILRGFIHPDTEDVDTVLYGPGGSGTARVLSDVGGSNPVNGIQLTIDDEAATQMPTSQLSGGRFKPTNASTVLDPMPAIFPNGNARLTVFNGDNPNGKWRFFVVDEDPPEGAIDGPGQFAGGYAVVIKAKVKR